MPAELTDPRPAAWEIEIAYPRRQIRIVGVELKRVGAKDALVRWSADPAAVADCNDPLVDGLLKVKVIDPDLATAGVRVAYELRNFNQSCGGRAGFETFEEGTNSFRAFDVDGNVMTTTHDIPANSFL